MKKRFISVVIALVMAVSFNAVAFAAPGGGVGLGGVADHISHTQPGIGSASAELFIDFSGY